MYSTPAVFAAHICRIYSSSTALWDATPSRYVRNPCALTAATANSTNRFTPSWLTRVLRTYLSRIFPTMSVVHEYNGDDAPEWSLRDRTVFAMILALFSVCAIDTQRRAIALCSPRWRSKRASRLGTSCTLELDHLE